MSYKRAEQVLPAGLIKIIQRYADGICIYIPRKQGNRRKWGENTNTLSEISKRNSSICEDCRSGMNVARLSEKYFLSPKSIQRIIKNIK